MSKKFSISFFAGWLSFSCYQPPIYLFTDPYLLPKWYLCLYGLVGVGVLMAVARLRGWKLPSLSEVLSSVASIFVAVSVLECLWMLICIVMKGLRPGGKVGTLKTQFYNVVLVGEEALDFFEGKSKLKQ